MGRIRRKKMEAKRGAFKVHLVSFRRPGEKVDVRPVDVPYEELLAALKSNPESALDLIFRYGQNDFQPKPFRSVSVGDIIEFFDDYYEVDVVGFRLIPFREFVEKTDEWTWNADIVSRYLTILGA
jgi:hypothetical protein